MPPLIDVGSDRFDNSVSSQNSGFAGRDNFTYGNVAGNIVDPGAIRLTGEVNERVFELFEEGRESNEREVIAAQEFARSLGRDFLGINLQSTRTEAAQRSADRNEIIRLAIPFLAVAAIGYAYFVGRK